MKNILSILILFALLVSSCSEDELVNNQSDNSMKFTASFEQNESRTYVEEGNLLRWTEGDQISLFDGNTLNRQFNFDGETGDNAGTFSPGEKPYGTGNDLNKNYAVYPYSSKTKISDYGVITSTLPAEQNYAENSFGLGANTMIAATQDKEDTFLKFKNVGGYLKLQLYGNDITVRSITLTGNNNEKLAGKATITSAYGQNPTISMSDNATQSITLDCGEGVKIGTTAKTATAFWIVVPPTTFEKGFTVTITDMDGNESTKSTSNEIVVERNVIKPMSAIKINPILDNMLNNFNPNQYLLFKNNNEMIQTNDDASKPDLEINRSYIWCPSTNSSKMEIKFQMANEVPTHTSFEVWLHDITFYYDQMRIFGNTYSWDDLNVGMTDLMTLEISYKDKYIKLNGVDLEHNIGPEANSFNIGGYIFSGGYYSDYDDGLLSEWKFGVPDNSKLYYIKAWDENDELIYLGVASIALNPKTNVEEYCWQGYYNGNKHVPQFAYNSETLTNYQPYGGGTDE